VNEQPKKQTVTKGADDLPRPLCPQCLSGYGDARVVTLKGQARTVTYVCATCLNEWDVASEAKSYEF